jgi:acyl-CoA oxidase
VRWLLCFKLNQTHDHNPSFEGDNYVLDQQVIRAALKSYTNLLKSKDVSNLSPSNTYLRLLVGEYSSPSLPLDNGWQDPAVSILLLEWRAALLVRELAQHVDELDASAAQRTARAITEAFIAARVNEMIKELPEVLEGSQRSVKVLERLYLLVRSYSNYVSRGTHTYHAPLVSLNHA